MRTLRLFLACCLLPMVALAQSAKSDKPKAPSADPTPAQTSSSESEAGDVSEVDKDALGPLRERIRPVSGHLFLKRHRLEISPSATVSIRDAFFRKYILGTTVTYYPWETLGFGLRAGYALNSVSGAAQICTLDEGAGRGCRAPTFAEIDGTAPGQLKLMAGLDAQWSPIYGKISLMAEKFAHFDMYGVLGASLVQYKGPSTQMTPGGNVGLGFRFFFNHYMTLRTEVRDLIYVEKLQGTDTSLRNQLMFELGFSFFLPTALPES
ncbi:MAG: outer membrane beta-barrel domain-containing protein [Hyalangium sp.]|uniref:outer membrane beta-barrel domain-containing protein n=1 Tax=Hyalangium sp. TaxID=2028555 RepID=UPI003899E881